MYGTKSGAKVLTDLKSDSSVLHCQPFVFSCIPLLPSNKRYITRKNTSFCHHDNPIS